MRDPTFPHASADTGAAERAALRPDRRREVTDAVPQGQPALSLHVSQDVLKLGSDACPVGRVPSTKIESAVIDQLRAAFRQPEIIVGVWHAARAEQDDVTEEEVREYPFGGGRGVASAPGQNLAPDHPREPRHPPRLSAFRHTGVWFKAMWRRAAAGDRDRSSAGAGYIRDVQRDKRTSSPEAARQMGRGADADARVRPV
jgi:hypothetical protein